MDNQYYKPSLIEIISSIALAAIIIVGVVKILEWI